MFGKTVLGIDGEHFEHALDSAKKASGAASDTDLDADDLRQLTALLKEIVREQAGRDFPQDPREQLDLAIGAVFGSWNGDRAVLYRRQERIPGDLGTAVNVVAMVFGNLGDDSGTGVAFTRDPATGAQGVYGDYLQNAQGEDVVAGIRNTVPLQDLERIDKASYDQLLHIMDVLEGHYKDLCDIEFTIERGKLWMLQTRVGKRTAAAAFRIATAAGGPGPHRHGRGADPGHRRRACPADVPRRSTPAPTSPRSPTGVSASPGRGRRQGRLRLRPRRRARGRGRGGHPGPPRDQPGRPERHDRRQGRPDQPRRQDQPRGRGRPRHGQAVRLRRRAARRGHRGQEVHRAGRHHGRRGRRDLHRRHQRRGLPRRGASRALPGRALLRGRADRPGLRRGRRAHPRGAPDHGPRRRQAPAGRARQRRQQPGRRPRPPVRRRGDRPGPHRAHVPWRAPPADRGSHPGRDRRGPPARAGRPRDAADRRLRRRS